MKEDKFIYKHTAPTQEERREIEDLRRRYDDSSKEKDDLTKLRELDAKVKSLPTVIGITLGVVGTLIFGLGLTMVLEWKIIVWGIIVAAIGLLPVAAANPAHDFLFAKNKKKYGEEILKISERLLNEESSAPTESDKKA